jgi:hypothetical protein
VTASADDRESLRDSLEQHRCELRAAMEDMGAAARSWSDPTVSIRSRPITWVVAAFLVGAWLGHQR